MPEDIRQHLIYLVNKYRREHGLHDLHLDHGFAAHAKEHSEHRVERLDEIKRGRLDAHTEHHWQGNWHSENVAYAESHGHEHPYQVAERLFEKWVSSEGHRKNILSAKSHAALDIGHREANGKKRIFMTGRFR